MVKEILGYFLYNSIGNIFPNKMPILGSKLGRPIRRFCAKLILGKNMGKNVTIEDHSVFSRNVQLGDNSGIGSHCNLGGTVYIGENVMMGPRVAVFTTRHRFGDVSRPMIEQGMAPEKPVYIGNDVWLGGDVIILPGVKISNGCVIGAGSVVREDIPAFAVVIGNPAQIVRYRNAD